MRRRTPCTANCGRRRTASPPTATATPLRTFQRTYTDIAALSDWMDMAISGEMTSECRCTPAIVGDLQDIRRRMVATLAAMTDTEKTEIERSLEELYL